MSEDGIVVGFIASVIILCIICWWLVDSDSLKRAIRKNKLTSGKEHPKREITVEELKPMRLDLLPDPTTGKPKKEDLITRISDEEAKVEKKYKSITPAKEEPLKPIRFDLLPEPKLEPQKSISRKPLPEDDIALQRLKMRLVKGEITIEDYKKMREVLES